MREFIIITLRTMTVLALVVSMPVLALPKVSARLSRWASNLYDNRFDSNRSAGVPQTFATRRSNLQADESVRWQAVVGRADQPSTLSGSKASWERGERAAARPRNR